MIVIIPAYKPDERLIGLIDELKRQGVQNIIAVDDGGGKPYAHVFEQARARGVIVLTHEVNRGKGRAMKTGFAYIVQHMPGEGAVIADADGQHLSADIIRVGEEMQRHPEAMILGTRRFTGDVPVRSVIGNSITRAVFLWGSGAAVADTQTGLRGIPFSLLPEIAQLEGERYELEMNMLLHAARKGIPFRQVIIETVYYNENKGSHFNVARDSFKIYSIIARFNRVSIAAYFLDILVFMAASLLLPASTGGIAEIILYVLAGRMAAVALKRLSLRIKKGEWAGDAVKTVSFFVFVAALSLLLGMPLLPARLLASLLTGIGFILYLNSKAQKIQLI